jgi:hypothetical protein
MENLGIFYGPFCGHLVHFPPVLVCRAKEKSGNPGCAEGLAEGRKVSLVLITRLIQLNTRARSRSYDFGICSYNASVVVA